MAAAGPWQTTVTQSSKTDAPDLNVLKTRKDDLDAFIRTLDGVPVLFQKAFEFDSQPFVEAIDKVNKAVAVGAISTREATNLKRDL